MKHIIGWLVVVAFSATVRAVEPFMAPARMSGSMSIKLFPMENVSVGNSVLVTFGVPFTRGSLSPAALSTVRVLDSNGAEIPAYVEMLTPWRHLADASLDGTSVRFARIQIHYVFSTAAPGYETVVVEWGLTSRTQNVATFTNPRSAWHLASTGDWTAADGVMEPDVYAVLPKEVMSEGVFKITRMVPFRDDVNEAPDDWAVMDAKTFSGYEEMDHAHKNFFYTVINDLNPFINGLGSSGFPPNPYKTQNEPWLYDRASTMFLLYFRSGFLTALRESVRNAEYYRLHIDSSGLFLIPGDPDKTAADIKYDYNECLAYAFWATGDDLHAQAIPLVAQAQESHSLPTRWTPTLNMWTERHAAFRLLANIVAFEATGGAAWRANVLRESGDFLWHQDGAGGQLPPDRVDGALYSYGRQNQNTASNAFGASPWMSALIADAMLRVYAAGEDPSVGHFLRRMGVWEKVALTFGSTWSQGLPNPWYFSLYGYCYNLDAGACSGDNYFGGEHAMEVSAVIAWGHYFSELLGVPDPSLSAAVGDLYLTAASQIKEYTRPSDLAQHYRVGPPRKWAWQHRPSGSLSWAMGGTVSSGMTLSLAASSITAPAGSTATVRVILTSFAVNPTTSPVSVDYTTTGGTAGPGTDFTPVSGTLHFPAGTTNGAWRDILVFIQPNDPGEPVETLTVVLSSPIGAVISGPVVNTLTIPGAGIGPVSGGEIVTETTAFPNPAVGKDPTIRAFVGEADTLEITLYDAAGAVVHSEKLHSSPAGTADGRPYHDYVWTNPKASGVYFAIIHGNKGGNVIRGRVKFIIVR